MFLGKLEKNIILSSAELAQRVVKLNNTKYFICISFIRFCFISGYIKKFKNNLAQCMVNNLNELFFFLNKVNKY